MCGINGVFHYRGGGRPDMAMIRRQAEAMAHRGPDDCGLWSDGSVAFGHRRLSIVDLSPAGHQPMCNEDESVWVTYNGEIYGWTELRPVLRARGHVFRGNSDTEALLHLYEEHGTGMMEKLRGMFAFGLFDRARRRLVLGRDRLGIKPLFYHDDGRRIVFASELKSLLLDPSVPREVDERAVADFLTFQYVPGPGTIWKGVRKLPPAHILVCDEHGVREERYWALPTDVDSGHSVEFYRERLLSLLAEAVRIRLVADVPLGAFLSGGLDSSLVVALMARAVREPIKTFTIGFEEERFSELPYARRVAQHLGTDHHEQILKPEALDLLPRLVWQMDEPFADASMIPCYFVSKMAREQVTVVLSGDGGDETYAGYTTYAWAQSYARTDWLPRPLRQMGARLADLLHTDHPLGRKLRRVSLDIVDRHLEVTSAMQPSELLGLLQPELLRALADYDPVEPMRQVHARSAAGLGDVHALLQLDAQVYMIDDVMTKVDRTSMMHSLEAREPLLDHHLLEFAARIPMKYKLRGQLSKWILRECAREMLPEEILKRGKQGFGIPLERWFGAGFDRVAREILLDSRCRERGWLSPRGLERLFDHPLGREERRTRQIWTLICLELWAQTYVDRPREELTAPLDMTPGGVAAQ